MVKPKLKTIGVRQPGVSKLLTVGDTKECLVSKTQDSRKQLASHVDCWQLYIHTSTFSGRCYLTLKNAKKGPVYFGYFIFVTIRI